MERRLEPREGQKALHHPTRYAQPLLAQYGIILHKFLVSYWRNPNYNASRWTTPPSHATHQLLPTISASKVHYMHVV